MFHFVMEQNIRFIEVNESFSSIYHRNTKYMIKKLRVNKYRLFLICFNFTNLIRLYYITIDLIIRKKRQFISRVKLEA